MNRIASTTPGVLLTHICQVCTFPVSLSMTVEQVNFATTTTVEGKVK